MNAANPTPRAGFPGGPGAPATPLVARSPSIGLAARVVGLAAWIYLGLASAVWVFLRLAADRWWPATLLMFGPRWAWGLPAAALLPGLAFFRPGRLWVLVASLLVVIGPVMGICLPWHLGAAHDAKSFRLRIVTCNVHRTQMDPTALGRLIADKRPEVIVLQDWTARQERDLFGESRYRLCRHDEMLVASIFPIKKEEALDGPEFADGKGSVIHCELETPVGVIHLFNIHLNSPRYALEDLLDRKWPGLEELERNSSLRLVQSRVVRRAVDAQVGPLVIAGDFNTPSESFVYRQEWAGLTNAFSDAGFGWGYTYYTRRSGVRIDHVLAGPGWRCLCCRVADAVGSPHRPVIADLEWVDSDARHGR